MKHLYTAVLSSVLVLSQLAAPVALAAEGDDYPRRPVRMLLPNAPGSSNDTLARILGSKLGEVLGQSIVIENQAGAAGLIGMETTKNAKADGYTIASASPSGMSIAPNLHRRLPYDPLNDFQFVSLYAVLPNLLVVTPNLPIKTVQDLIDYAKARPGQCNMASAGPGSQSHLAGVMLQLMGNFTSLHVPYKGGGASVIAVMAGETQWYFSPASSVISHVRSGKLRAVAHSMPQRTALLQDVPAVSETVKGFNYSAWNGIVVPKGTPQVILDKLRAALIKTVALPDIKEGINKQGAEVVINTPEEFRALVQAEIEATAKVVKATDLKAE